MDNLMRPFNLDSMFLSDGRKPEYPEKAFKGRIGKLHTERLGIEPAIKSFSYFAYVCHSVSHLHFSKRNCLFRVNK